MKKENMKVFAVLLTAWIILSFAVTFVFEYISGSPKYSTHPIVEKQNSIRINDIRDYEGNEISGIPENASENDIYLVLAEGINWQEWIHYSPKRLNEGYDFISLKEGEKVFVKIEYSDIQENKKIDDEDSRVYFDIVEVDRTDLKRAYDGMPIIKFDPFNVSVSAKFALYMIPLDILGFVILWFLANGLMRNPEVPQNSTVMEVAKIIFLGIALFILISLLIMFVPWPGMYISKAPIIYLYPEEEQEVSVRLDLNGDLTTTYPNYNDGWNVVASPDGKLTDSNGRTYDYLYWEAELSFEPDFSQGFCVKGEDTAKFLEEALDELGLTESESNTFIMYWLPQMEKNEYNVISFQTDRYEEAAVHEVSPAPDSVITVYMAYYSVPYEVSINPQDLSSLGNTERQGFTLVEWGGSEVGSIDGEFRRIVK